MTRIAFVHSNNHEVGGSDLAMFRVVLAARDAGHDPLVVLSKDNAAREKYRSAQIPVTRIQMPRLTRSHNPLIHARWGATTVATTLRLARFFTAHRIDVVVGNDINELPALFAARLLGIPAIVRIRLVFQGSGLIRRGYLGLLSAAATRVSCVSHYVRNMNFRRREQTPEHVGVLYDWQEPTAERPGSLTRSPFSNFGIPEAARVVFMPGRMEPLKGQQVLVEAIPRILRTVPECYFLFTGSTVRGRGRESFRDELRSRCSALGVLSRSIFSDHVDDVDALIRASDVLVHATVGPEAFGLTVLEGLWHGTPVVASRSGGPEEIAGAPPVALFHDPGDAEQLADAVIQVMTDGELAEALRKSGPKRASEFSRERLWPLFDRLFRELGSAAS
jgi:glycosyltransferase involved in cell wall biosynthesis